MADAIFSSIGLNGRMWPAPSPEVTSALNVFRKNLRALTEAYRETPSALRSDANFQFALTQMRHVIDDMMIDKGVTVGMALNSADRLMARSRDIISKLNNPRVRHGAPLAKAARAYAQLLRSAITLKEAREKQEAMGRLNDTSDRMRDYADFVRGLEARRVT